MCPCVFLRLDVLENNLREVEGGPRHGKVPIERIGLALAGFRVGGVALQTSIFARRRGKGLWHWFQSLCTSLCFISRSSGFGCLAHLGN